MEKKYKHLEFLQAAISRMAGNLFLLKGWSITLIAALFALSAKDSNKLYMLLAYYPLIVFWVLDGYFLSLERRFRALYDHVRCLSEDQIDFSMDTRSYQGEYRNTWLGSLLSNTLLIYYGALAGVMLVMMFVLK